MLSRFSNIFGLITLVLVAIVVIGSFKYTTLRTNKLALDRKVTELEEALKNTTDSLNQISSQNATLLSTLNAEKQKSSSFAQKIDSITTTVEALERLKNTDPQLLQKYSKVYFLNENYTPSALTPIDTKYLSNKSKPLEFHDRIWPFLKNLLDAAAADGITLQVASAYRSFDTQATLKSNYKVTYGAGTANQFSADQGYSEHQLGSTVDFTTPEIGSGLSGFEKTKAYTWLKNNAYKYGFILSYPPNNDYYIFEPWHWRFVSLDFAKALHVLDNNFYDLDQREISNYLVNFFNSELTSDTTSSR